MLWTILVIKSGFQPHQSIYKMACAVKDSHGIPYTRVYTQRYMAFQAPLINGVHNIVLVRHGESEWNKLNIFCGWYNSDLTEKGKKEAATAGKILKEANYKFDMAFTSVLKRANLTLDIILKETGQERIPIVKSWRLNERHYGDLTGLNKAQLTDKYGEKQVAIWRRSFDVPPPLISQDNPYYLGILNDPIYRKGPSKHEFPKAESLKQLMERLLPFWNGKMVPEIKKGKSILIAAHVSSLRALIKHLDQLSNTAIMKVNLPTSTPFRYALDEDLRPVPKGSLQYMEDEATVRRRIKAFEDRIKGKKT